MTSRQPAVLHHCLHGVGQLQKTQRVSNVAAALADDLRQGLLGAAEAVHQGAVAQGLFDRVQVRTLNVFDDRLQTVQPHF